MPNVTVYTKDSFPAEWHYSDHPRIPEILVLADPGRGQHNGEIRAGCSYL